MTEDALSNSVTGAVRNEATTLSQPEILRPHEGLRLVGINAIVLFHAPGAGGSTIGRELAKRLGARFYDGGKSFRTALGASQTGTAYMDREADLDMDIDQTQIALMESASSSHPVVIDAKLGARNALLLEQTNPDIRTARVLITCDKDVAAGRIFEREVNAIRKAHADLAKRADSGKLGTQKYLDELEALGARAAGLDIDRIKQENEERTKRDKEVFAQLYPELAGVDLYTPGAKIRIGDRDLKLANSTYSSTRTPSGEQGVEDVIQKLVGKGWAKRLRRRPGKSVDVTADRFWDNYSDRPTILYRSEQTGQLT